MLAATQPDAAPTWPTTVSTFYFYCRFNSIRFESKPEPNLFLCHQLNQGALHSKSINALRFSSISTVTCCGFFSVPYFFLLLSYFCCHYEKRKLQLKTNNTTKFLWFFVTLTGRYIGKMISFFYRNNKWRSMNPTLMKSLSFLHLFPIYYEGDMGHGWMSCMLTTFVPCRFL